MLPLKNLLCFLFRWGLSRYWPHIVNRNS